MTVPPSLLGESVVPVWQVVRQRLETRGTDNRGRVRLPELDRDARLALKGLFGRQPGVTIDLAALELRLRELGVGPDLPSALAALGVPVSTAADERRAQRRHRGDAREAARRAAADWPVPWATAWIDEVIAAGLLRGRDVASASGLVDSVRSVLEHLGVTGSGGRTVGTGGRPFARAELAAQVLGDAHALDRGRTLEAATSRAIRHALAGGRRGGENADDDPWSGVGVHSDLVSGAALTWGLPLLDVPVPGRAAGAGSAGSLAALTERATALGVPLHLTAMALRRSPIAIAPGTVLLATENPRVVEAAAERRLPVGMICTNGNPSATVRLLVEQLVRGGGRVLFHGDVDTPGLAICARMQRLGAVPWRMTADDYWDALVAADASGVVLPVESAAPGPTPWDPALRDLFDAERRIVHEERVLDDLLGALVDLAR